MEFGQDHLRIDPYSQIRAGHHREAHNNLAQSVTVALHIVTALTGEGTCIGVTAQFQRDNTYRRFRLVRVTGRLT
jgi:hypothetical protein